MHRHRVDILVFDDDIGEFCSNFIHDGAPELGDFENVCLVDTGELFAALRGELKSDACHTGYFVACVAHGVPRFAFGLVPLPGSAEVEATEQLADKENVGAIDDFGTERTVDSKLFEGERRAEIGESTERG